VVRLFSKHDRRISGTVSGIAKAVLPTRWGFIPKCSISSKLLGR
jgi:hypothetical protein